MKYIQFIIVALIIVISTSCKPITKPEASQEKTKVIKPSETPIPVVDLDSLNNEYLKLKSTVNSFKQKAANNQFSNKEIHDFLFNIISKDYYNYWEGTDWDFNGITEKPRQGMIACGYYVTTNLKHAGVNLNRYKFAQQLGSVIINSMCEKNSIKRMAGLERVENYLNSYTGNKLFILAMDNHVGFAIRENGKNYFMHAGFTGKAVVVKELVNESDILQASRHFMIGDLLGNETLINKWKHNTRIAMLK